MKLTALNGLKITSKNVITDSFQSVGIENNNPHTLPNNIKD